MPFGHSRKAVQTLRLGLAVIAAIVVLEGYLGTRWVRRSQARSRRMYMNSIESIEDVTRIARDIDHQRILVESHIFAPDDGTRARLEHELEGVADDLREAKAAYGLLIELPNEAATWEEAQGPLSRFEAALAGALELSRLDRDAEARTKMVGVADDYFALEGAVLDLVNINRLGVVATVEEIEKLQRTTEGITLASRTIALVAILLLGLWGTRRIAAYERRLAEYSLHLEERNRDLDAFAGRVAHDMKNALGPLMMVGPLLKRAPEDSSRVLETAARAERAVQRAGTVVDALLAFSRAARTADEHEVGPVGQAVEDVVEELAPLIARLGVSVEVEPVPDMEVRCDPGLLHTVLANLVGNAVKYLEGRPVRQVRIAVRREAASCLVEVSDTGPGIPWRAQRRIFEPFFRVEGSSAPGTGIGLATVRRIVEARGGRVSVVSTVGAGSRFECLLPLAQGSAAGAGTPPLVRT
jgi:signal transduction histidine kinase